MFAVKEKSRPIAINPVLQDSPKTVEKTLEPDTASPAKQNSQTRTTETMSFDPRKQPSEGAQQTIPAMNKRAKKEQEKNTEKV